MKILVVDDHALIREALRGVLKEVKGDAAVLEASDCRQAMQLIAEHADLSLILLDLTLPDRDGFSVQPSCVSATRRFRSSSCPPCKTEAASSRRWTSACSASFRNPASAR